MGVGRKPKPTALKVLEGNPGKRPLNGQEPHAPVRVPSCPAVLGSEARKEYRRAAKLLVQMGVVTEADRAALAAYAMAYGRWVEAERNVAENGMIQKTSNGNLIQNPYLSVANRALEQMVKIAAEFGMTPAARSKLHVEPHEEESLADILFAEATERVTVHD